MPLSPALPILPIDEHLEVAVILGGCQAAALAVEHQYAVFGFPVLLHVFVGCSLGVGQHVGRKLAALRGIVVGHREQAFPAT